MDRDERAQWVPLLISARKVWNWTQQDLADAAGISLKSVGNLEKQEMVPQEGTVEKVRSALQLPDNLNVAEHEIDERMRRRYEEANKIANARLTEQDSGVSLSRFSNAELLRELLTRAEDSEYAESLDREAEARHWVEVNQALDEIGPLPERAPVYLIEEVQFEEPRYEEVEEAMSEEASSVREAMAAHPDQGDIVGEQETRNET